MPVSSNRKQVLLWVAAAVAACAGLAAVLILTRHPAQGRRSIYVVGVPEKGAALFYGSKRCSICHSINGEGGRIGPDLSGTSPSAPAMGWLTAALWNHAPGMWRQMRRGSQASPQLNPEEMAHLLAFLYQAGTMDRPGDVKAGRLVFEEKLCVRCHSVRGQGGTTAPDLAKIATAGGAMAWTGAMWNHAQSMIGPIAEAAGKWPQFTGTEMNDLLAFVREDAPKAARRKESSGNAERGWKVFQAQCMQCHSVRGQGGKLGPGLGPEKDIPLGNAAFASVLWNHAPAMMKEVHQKGLKPPMFQGEEMADLTAFLASLRYFEPVGSSLVGERLFTERGCAQCHGPKADGTRYAPRLVAKADAYTTVSLAVALWSHGAKMINRFEELGVTWPTLAPTEISDLISFLNDPARQN